MQSVGLLTWPQTYLPFTSPDYVLGGLASWWSAGAVRSTIVGDVTFIAEVGGHVVGTATLGTLGEDRVIWKLYVVPAQQGTGVGDLLMQAMLGEVPESEPVLVEFIEGNERARRFYQRHGFVPDHTEDDEDGPTTVWFRKPAQR